MGWFDRFRRKPPPPSIPPPITGVVQASGSAGPRRRDNSMKIEEVMALATMEALKMGVTDPDDIRRVKLAARDDFKGALMRAGESGRPVNIKIGEADYTVRPV